MTPQILIVGAGPVGLTMAMELARYGVSVRIVEKAAARTDKSKALVLWARTLELLGRSGPAEAFIAAGHKVTSANIYVGDSQLGHIDLTAIDSNYAYALMLAQSETERLLDERLAGFGVTVEREVELLRFTQSDTGVTAILRHKNGREETVRTDWLIGCDGAHSTVRHALGLQFDGDTLPADFLLADLHIKGLKTPPSELPLYWHREGVLAMFPITADRYRIIADLGAG
jgi:2-polyprenyl-6-methoxyphenol hydroxylase-like FAD-dependent oxidoreductase